MLRHVIAPARFFTKAPNEIIRHPRLGSDAKVLLLYVQGLPEGQAGRPLSEHAAAPGIKGRGFQKAKRQLAADGYFHDWRWQGERGRWVTDQVLSNVQLSREEAERVRSGGVPAAQIPAVGGPGGRKVGDSPKGKNTGRKNTPLPASSHEHEGREPEAEPEGREGAQPESDEDQGLVPVSAPLVERGVQALAAVSHGERQLRLGGREVKQLAPLAAEWLVRGASVDELREALVVGLPERVHCPAALVRDRLMRKMPQAPSFAVQQAAEAAARPVGPRAACSQCGQLFGPVAGEHQCPACRRHAAQLLAAGGRDVVRQRGVAACRAAVLARKAVAA